MTLRGVVTATAIALALAGCGAPDQRPDREAITKTVVANEVATYPFTADQAKARFDAVAPTGEWVSDTASPGCQAAIGPALSLRACTSDGKVRSLVVTARGGASPAKSEAISRAAMELVAPDADARDITLALRVVSRFSPTGGVVCPSIQCFRVATVGGQLMISMDAQGI